MTNEATYDGEQLTVSLAISPEIETVLASNLIIGIGPQNQGHDEFWRTVLLSVPDPAFLALAHQLHEQQNPPEKEDG